MTREKCLKKVILVQVVLVCALLTAVLTAYFLRNGPSKRDKGGNGNIDDNGNDNGGTTQSSWNSAANNTTPGKNFSSLFGNTVTTEADDDLFITTVEILKDENDNDNDNDNDNEDHDDFITTVNKHESSTLYKRNYPNENKTIHLSSAKLPFTSQVSNSQPPVSVDTSTSSESTNTQADDNSNNNSTTNNNNENEIESGTEISSTHLPISTPLDHSTVESGDMKDTVFGGRNGGNLKKERLVGGTTPNDNDNNTTNDDYDYDYDDDESPLRNAVNRVSKHRPQPIVGNPFKHAKATRSPSSLPSDGPSMYPSMYPSSAPSISETKSLSESPTDLPTDVTKELVIINQAPSSSPSGSVFNESSACPLTYEDGDGTPCSASLDSQECFYDFAYVGCTWNSLGCSSTAQCKCEIAIGEEDGLWSCMRMPVESCNLRRQVGLPEIGQTCDPNEELPIKSGNKKTLPISKAVPHSKFPVTESAQLASTTATTTCPEDPGFGRCDAYSDDLQCKYDFIYTGCTWDVVACTPAVTCDCKDGAWQCSGDFATPCEYAEGIIPPEGLQWGKKCDPNQVLPTNSKKTECPASFELGKCDEYEDYLQCKYNHVYKGCTWDTLTCSPAVECECLGGNWQCWPDFEKPCEAEEGLVIPEGLPWGQECNPNEGLPAVYAEMVAMFSPSETPSATPTTPKPSGTPSATPTYLPTAEPSKSPTAFPTNNDSTHQLSRECSNTFQYGECYEEYDVNLQCAYNHVYRGCTWEDLACLPSIECKCDHWYGYWQCKSTFDNCSANLSQVVPKDLPMGEACDPSAALPVPSN